MSARHLVPIAAEEPDLFLRTVDSIYEAATDPEHWQDVVEALCCAFPGGHGTVLHHDVGAAKGMFAKTSGWDPTWVQTYNDHFSNRNPWLARLKKRPVGMAVPAEFMLDRADLVKTEFYADFLRPQGLISGVGVTLAQDSERFVVASVLYCETTERAATQNVQYLQRLTPHLQRAIQVNQRLEMAAIRANAAEESLHKLRAGLLLVSSDGKVLFSNHAADAILRKGDGLSLNRAGQVTVAASSTGARLKQAIQSTAMPLASGSLPPGGTVTVERPSGRSSYALLVTPVRRVLSELTADQASAAIFISHRDFGAAPELLSEALGITRAEGRVLSQLLTGCTIPDCGARMEISPHTARTHLRHIFDKLGVSSKGQLMKHVAHHPIWLVDVR